jgi:hypothetical protein
VENYIPTIWRPHEKKEKNEEEGDVELQLLKFLKSRRGSKVKVPYRLLCWKSKCKALIG